MGAMEIIQTILAICGGISIIGGAVAVIHNWISPAIKLNDRVETLERHDRRDYEAIFQSTPPRGWRQQYYTITTTILQHISTNKSYPTPSNHGQPSLHTRKSVLIVQIFRCESPRKSMFASGSHQNTLYRFTARGQVRISAVLPH